MARGAHFLAHRASVADNSARPGKHLLSLGGQPLKARTAMHQHHAELVLQLLDRGRQRGLGNAQSLSRPSEMLLLGERNEEFQLVDHSIRQPAVRRASSL